MKNSINCSILVAGMALCMLAGCSRTDTRSPDVSGAVRQSLDQAGLKDVSVSEDRDKGVVTLGGRVANEDAKGQAGSIAKSVAGGQVVANQVAVVPPDDARIAKTVNSDLDKGIEKNLDAALAANRLDALKFDVKNRVVVLKGEVDSPARRAQAAQIAGSVPNVEQVVNELQVKDQKATSN